MDTFRRGLRSQARKAEDDASGFIARLKRLLNTVFTPRIDVTIPPVPQPGAPRAARQPAAAPAPAPSVSGGSELPPQLAEGGRVSARETVIVGDGGEPELFTPDRSGTVTPVSRLPEPILRPAGRTAPRAAPGAGSGRQIRLDYRPSISLSVQMPQGATMADVKRAMNDLERRLGEDVEAALRARFADIDHYS